MRLRLDGMAAEEIRRAARLIDTAGRRETVVLRLAVAMSDAGEESGARWLVRRLLDARERRGGRPD